MDARPPVISKCYYLSPLSQGVNRPSHLYRYMKMPSAIDLLKRCLATLLPEELRSSELTKLVVPNRHPSLLVHRRATLLVNRVRLFALLFAVLTPVWAVMELIVFDYPLWLGLVSLRLLTCAAFACILMVCRPDGDLLKAYRAVVLLFAIPALFYIAAYALLDRYQLSGFSVAVASSYAFLPLVLMAGLAVFPLTLIESVVLVSALLLAQVLACCLTWSSMSWPSFAGGFWLLILMAGVATLASLSQLAFMIALTRQAVRDSLTGVFSRGSGQEILQLQWDTSRRNDNGLSVAFIDIDSFKSINDTFGAAAGDHALRACTQRMLASLRSTDTVFRWSAEEFIVIMPDTDREQACLALNRMVRNGFGMRPNGAMLTASIGLAERCADFAESPSDLLKLARERMYQARMRGHNQLCYQTDPAISGVSPVSGLLKTHA